LKEIENKLKDELADLGVLRLNEPMRKHTSFKTGGPADILIWPDSVSCLREIVLLSKVYSIPVTVLGGCTNLLVGDKGIRGIVIMMNSISSNEGAINIEENGLIYADSIIKKDRFITFCADEGYEGMEFMAGIPGCLGGGIIMNAGTTDGYFAGILDSIECMDMDGRISSNTEHKEKAIYRTIGLPGNLIITGAFFRLNKTRNVNLVSEKISAIIKDRKMKHPLDYPSAGSVFKNPAGHSSWKLVNESGLKGKGVGGAFVSELHTNFIINKGDATSLDISNLVDLIKERVFSKFNITLETEIKFIGDF
jgi:UDP-N-acetylmuramate dehydrogenase